jgi:hypothetical protein
MERIGRGDDHRVLGERGELIDPRQPLRVSACQVRVALDDLWAGYPAPLRFRRPEVPEADQRVVVAPLVSPFDTRALDSPVLPRGGILPGRDADASLLHLIRECVQDADHDHTVGAAV